MDSILTGLPHVACYIDDILITGRNDSKHLKNLEKVLARLEEYGVKAKRDKCLFLSKCVQYLGHNNYRQNGVAVLPDKVQAIVKAPLPKNKNELRSFLGFINYYWKFIPQLSAILAPLNALLQKQVQWKWTKDCSRAGKPGPVLRFWPDQFQPNTKRHIAIIIIQYRARYYY